MILNLLSGIAAKVGAAGLAAKAGVGLTMAAASVTGGAAAGVLPDPVQDRLASVVAKVTPLEFPEVSDDRAHFGQHVSNDARDDQPGVDGPAIADQARQRGEERRGEAGAPDDPTGEGLDRARQTPAKDHLPAAVPAGQPNADQYRPVEPPSGTPADVPAGRPENLPSGQPEGTPSSPPDGTPDAQPEDLPSGQPEPTPDRDPESVPAPSVGTPTGQPDGARPGRP